MESQQRPPADQILAMFFALPAGQLILIVLATIVWLIGVNVLMSSHHKRIGKEQVSWLRPFMQFNSKEWQIFFLLFVISAIFMLAALYWESAS